MAKRPTFTKNVVHATPSAMMSAKRRALAIIMYHQTRPILEAKAQERQKQARQERYGGRQGPRYAERAGGEDGVVRYSERALWSGSG